MKTLLSAAISDASCDSHPSEFSLSRASLTRRSATGLSTGAVECPKCGKHSIVARSSNTFDCLNCTFHRELPPVTRRVMGQQAQGLSSSGHSMAPRRRLNTLLSSKEYGSLLASPSEIGTGEIDTDDMGLDEIGLHETGEPDGSQPWVFAAIAVIFGILLL